ncbi:MAG: EamA family transporter [Lachnospiraceae bacterium]|nr:EamA family transporter [Lachnospiraceae bacterium]
MNTTHKTNGTLLIILAGIFWGSMGIFVRGLTALAGFTSIQIVCVRLTVAALTFALILLIKDARGFRIRIKDIPLFLGLGFCSILFFTTCYFTAIRMMTLSIAAILLYTSPIWVMLLSLLLFHEKMTRPKFVALVISFLGCIFVSGIGSGGSAVTPAGILIGLGAGLGYGLYSILGTLALRRYSTYTVTAYTFITAAAGSLFISSLPDLWHKITACTSKPYLYILIVLTGLVTAVIPFLLYTLGLEQVEASRAAILATIEPMVATLIGVVVFHEYLTVLSVLGILCILAAIVLLNHPSGAAS